MKYFAKYLPVEGEIKEGDMYITPSGNVVKALGPCNFTKEWRKLKLFLCSRNIQVGDTITWLDRYRWIMFQEFSVNSQEGTDIMKRVHAGKWGVKIGEISPDAIWVKEGDEFEENQVTEPMLQDAGAWKPYCYIQCPTCKKFH